MEYFVIDHLNRKQIARIFSKVAVDRETGCWLWTAYKTRGYGRLRWGDTMGLAHRIVYAWAVGPLPKGKSKTTPELDHIVCNNPSCCNPSHVKLVLPRANILRGISPVAENARRRTCKQGHEIPITPNLKVGKRTLRLCVLCHYQEKRDYHKRMINGPRREEYKAKRAAAARTEAAKLRSKTYGSAWSKRRRYGPLRERVLEKDRLYQRERRAKKKMEASIGET